MRTSVDQRMAAILTAAAAAAPFHCRLSVCAVILRVLGEGTFGRVYLAREQSTSQLVALKKVRIKRAEEGLPKVLMREIRALESLSGESHSPLSRHVVQLRAHFAHGSAVVLVLELMQSDLLAVMRAVDLVGARMHPRAVKACMHMILTGVRHTQRIAFARV